MSIYLFTNVRYTIKYYTFAQDSKCPKSKTPNGEKYVSRRKLHQQQKAIPPSLKNNSHKSIQNTEQKISFNKFSILESDLLL